LFLTAVAVAALAGGAPTERPAVCTDGRSIGPLTEGHCCWPGQVWRGDACLGAPTVCPGGLGQKGFDCVPANCEPPLAWVDGQGCRYPEVPATGPVKTVHWSEIQVSRRVNPEPPPAELWGGETEVSCEVRFRISSTGAIEDVVPKSCPLPFFEYARPALLEWSFYPPPQRPEDPPASVSFAIKVMFRREP
jgi:hypothetical protein